MDKMNAKHILTNPTLCNYLLIKVHNYIDLGISDEPGG